MAQNMLPNNAMPILEPKLTIEKDYEGYFERLVKSWIDQKRQAGKEFQHSEIVVTSGPYRSDAVRYRSTKDKILHLDFYSALRRGFGELTQEDVNGIIELL